MKLKYKIGVFGSATDDLGVVSSMVKQLARELGKYKDEVIVVSGVTSGIPYLVSSEASKNGIELWGFSPVVSFAKQNDLLPNCDNSIYSQLIYIPKNYEFASNIEVCKKYRNVTSVANCDAGIIISGRWGTMNEFTNLFDMGKVIGILTGTGGIANEIYNLNQKIKKDRGTILIFSDSPKKLVEKILLALQKSKINNT